MAEDRIGPAVRAGQQTPGRVRSRPDVRPYPAPPEGAATAEVVAAVLSALLHATSEKDLRDVLATAVGDLGGALVPARLEPRKALPLDVSLGVGEPLLVVVEPFSVTALELGRVLPGLLADAQVLQRRLVVEDVLPVGDTDADVGALPGYLGLVADGQRDRAVALVRTLLRSGVSTASVVRDVLVPAQHQVGEHWYDGTWSVADEHAATAIAETCAGVLPERGDGPRVVFASPEGEWHVLPARLAALAADVRCTVLGPGLPAADLRRYLESEQPDALALSCTLATALLPATEAVAAAHEAGVPVVLGGRALGGSPARAARLGADGFAASPAVLADLVPSLVVGEAVPPPHEAWVAHVVSDAVLDVALLRQATTTPWLHDVELVRGRRGLRWVVGHAAAALACDDPTVLDEGMAWLTGRLERRGAPPRIVADSALYVADALEPEAPAVAQLLRAAGAV